jgi:hypothetical protein
MRSLTLLAVGTLAILSPHSSGGSLATTDQASAAQSAGPRNQLSSDAQQFDLECVTRGAVVADPNPRSRGNYRANDPAWENDSRYVIDLRAMRYCVVGTCGSIGTMPISAVTEDEIVLVDEKEGSARQFDAIRRNDHRFMGTITRRDGFLSSTKGTCRRLPFSGLPPEARDG